MDYSKPIKSLAQANDATEELWKEMITTVEQNTHLMIQKLLSAG